MKIEFQNIIGIDLESSVLLLLHEWRFVHFLRMASSYLGTVPCRIEVPELKIAVIYKRDIYNIYLDPASTRNAICTSAIVYYLVLIETIQGAELIVQTLCGFVERLTSNLGFVPLCGSRADSSRRRDAQFTSGRTVAGHADCAASWAARKTWHSTGAGRPDAFVAHTHGQIWWMTKLLISPLKTNVLDVGQVGLTFVLTSVVVLLLLAGSWSGNMHPVQSHAAVGDGLGKPRAGAKGQLAVHGSSLE